jgi:hypothetical protein
MLGTGRLDWLDCVLSPLIASYIPYWDIIRYDIIFVIFISSGIFIYHHDTYPRLNIPDIMINIPENNILPMIGISSWLNGGNVHNYGKPPFSIGIYELSMAIFLKLCNKWPEGTNHIPKRAGGSPKPKELHELIGKVRCFARALPSDKVPCCGIQKKV